MIFDRFKQVDKSLSRNAEGTGIGLSLVKSIVELHGGSIYVESEYGKGSKFTVSLPSERFPKRTNYTIAKYAVMIKIYELNFLMFIHKLQIKVVKNKHPHACFLLSSYS